MIEGSIMRVPVPVYVMKLEGDDTIVLSETLVLSKFITPNLNFLFKKKNSLIDQRGSLPKTVLFFIIIKLEMALFFLFICCHRHA